MKKFKNLFLIAAGLFISCGQAICAMEGSDFLNTITNPHDDLSETIEPLMLSLPSRDVSGIFKGLAGYFERNCDNQGDVLDTEMEALQPWSVITMSAWKDSSVFKQSYAPFLQKSNEIQKSLEGKTFEQRLNFLLDMNQDKGAQIKGNYTAQAQSLIASFEIEEDIQKHGTIFQTHVIYMALLTHKIQHYNNTPMAFFLLERYKGSIPMEGFLASLLTSAACFGNTQWALVLLEKYPELISMNHHALHYAAQMGHVEFVGALLEKFSGLLTSRDDMGQTSLHYACGFGFTEVALTLLNRDLLCIENEDGQTALDLACDNHQTDLLQALMTHEIVKDFIATHESTEEKIKVILGEI